MNIIGYSPNSFVDYPENISAVIFIGGCNFSCWYCHNKWVINEIGDYDEVKILENIKNNVGFLDAVTITGGEPTQERVEDLLFLIKQIKSLGLRVKLDTNGTNPDKLKELIPYLDYVAMDIKAPFHKYNLITTLTKEMIDDIKESITLIMKMPNYEFRTTFVPELSMADILEIASYIKGAKRLYLQQFRPLPEYKDIKSHSPDFIRNVAKESNKIIPTLTRGI